MAITVKIPTPLRKFTAGAESVEGEGSNVGELLNDLESRHTGLHERLCDEQGKVRRFVNLYVNGEDIRFLQQLDTPVKDGDDLAIVPAIAGGRS